ncbi:MAG: nucleotidyltransferase family protein [Deltaproteobacteria bacterium]|nr:nucleotidyltransferase family protein [Deltaproteobacteria bacterium]
MNVRISYDETAIAAFCRKWRVAELALFGSVTGPDFGPDSDVDVLVTFQPDAGRSLLDWAGMEDELAEIFGRPVDLVERQGVRNPFRRKAILDSAKVIHAA